MKLFAERIRQGCRQYDAKRFPFAVRVQTYDKAGNGDCRKRAAAKLCDHTHYIQPTFMGDLISAAYKQAQLAGAKPCALTACQTAEQKVGEIYVPYHSLHGKVTNKSL